MFNFSQLKTELLAPFLLPSTALFSGKTPTFLLSFLAKLFKILIYNVPRSSPPIPPWNHSGLVAFHIGGHLALREAFSSLGFEQTMISWFSPYFTSCYILRPLRIGLRPNVPSQFPLLVLSHLPHQECPRAQSCNCSLFSCTHIL